MRQKRLKLSTLLLLSFGLTGAQAQTINVTRSSGTQTAYALNNIQKMSFSSGILTVTKTDNSSGVYALSDLRKLIFSDMVTNIQESWSVENQLSSYPNPTKNSITIHLQSIAKGQGKLSLHNIEGTTVLSQQVGDSPFITVDMSNLPSGIYICRYSDDSYIKTVKIIKQ